MQIITSYFYPNIIQVQYDTDPSISTRNRVVYNRTIRVYRGVNNPVTIQVKNRDNKAVNITGLTVKFNVFNDTGSNLLLSKTATVTTAASGLASVLLTDYELLGFNSPLYNYSITLTSSNGEIVAYADDNFGVRGELRVEQGPYPELRESINVGVTTLNQPDLFTSSVIPDSSYKGQSSNHTAQFYFANFTGVITVQGTLDELPTSGSSGSAELSWSDVAFHAYTNQNTTDYVNWVGSYTAFRFVITRTSGEVTKILVRS